MEKRISRFETLAILPFLFVCIFFIIWHYSHSGFLFVFVTFFHVLYIARIVKAIKDFEATRHGEIARSTLGLIFLLVTEYFFLDSSVTINGVTVRNIDSSKIMTDGHSLYFPIMWILFAFSVGIYSVAVASNMRGDINPSFGNKYILALSVGVSASAFTCGVLSFLRVIAIPISETSYVAVNLSKFSGNLFFILVLTQIVMSRRHVDTGEEAVISFFGRPLYTVNLSGTIIVPPIFLTLSLFFDLFGWNRFGFSYCYKAAFLDKVAPLTFPLKDDKRKKLSEESVRIPLIEIIEEKKIPSLITVEKVVESIPSAKIFDFTQHKRKKNAE